MAEHHLGVASQVFGRGKQARMAGHAAQQIGPRVVHLSHHPASLAFFGGGRTAAKLRAGVERRLVHAQWAEDVFPGEAVQRLAGDFFHQQPQHDEAHVGITEPFARRA